MDEKGEKGAGGKGGKRVHQMDVGTSRDPWSGGGDPWASRTPAGQTSPAPAGPSPTAGRDAEFATYETASPPA
eukprot:4342692-Lingulodinium_polyedra.AAC.1